MALTPQEQTLFQQLQAKSAMQDVPAQQSPVQQSMAPTPEDAIKQIAARASGPKLQQRPDGLVQRVPVDQPLLRLFGIKKDEKVGPDYFDAIKQGGLTDFIPQGVPRTPSGTPFIGGKTADEMKQLAAAKKALPEQPSKEWGEALKSKVIEQYGPDSPRSQAIIHAIDASGGVPLSKLSEISNALVTTPKQQDLFKGEDGKMYVYDRQSGESKPILGNVGGALSSFNPLELKLVQAEMKGFDNDTVVQAARKQIGQLTSISALVDGRNPAALGIMASNIAKGLGREAGVLTEGDISRATGSQQLGDKWKRFWAKNVKGQLSDTDVSDFNALIYDINTAAQKQVDNVATNRSKRLGNILKRDPKELKGVISFGTEYMPAEEKPPLEQANPFTAARPGSVTEGQTKSGVKFKVIQE